MKFFGLILLFVIVCQTVFATPFGKHTFHTSLTRIDYNEKEKNIEISIQLFSHDVIAVLEKLNKKSLDLEKNEADELIFKYIEANFILKDKNGEVKKLKWVGKEVSVDTVYVFIETPSEIAPSGFSMQNSIFFESFDEQTNLVLAKYGTKKADLLFKRGDKFKEIKES